MSDIAEELRSLADTASRHGHYDRLNAASEAVERLTRELAEAREALWVMVEAEADYMRINNLGDPEKLSRIKLARAALASPESEE